MHNLPLSWPQRGRLWLRLGIRFVGAGLTVLLVWTLGGPILSLFMPFLLALAAAAALNPVIGWLQRKLGGSRRRAALITLLVLLGGIGGALVFLVRAAVQELVALADNRDSLLEPMTRTLGQVEQAVQSVLDKLPWSPGAPKISVMERLGSSLSSAWLDLGELAGFATERARDITSFAVALVMFLLASYFLCADYPYLRTRAIQNMDGGVWELFGQVRRVALAAFGGYLKAQVLLSLGVFFILLTGFALVGQSYALLLAAGLAALDFIPIVGAGTVLVPWAIIRLLSGDPGHGAALAAVWGAVTVFRRFAEPKVVGDQTGLSPVVSLISIYVGMRLGGVLGMILAPVAALVVLNLRGLGLLNGTVADLRLAGGDIMAILRDVGERSL